MSDVAKIANGLTKAQRKWLLSAEPTLAPVPKTPCAKWWDNPRRLYVTLDGNDYWLGFREMCSPEGSPRFETGSERLTETGLAVRQYLTENPHG